MHLDLQVTLEPFSVCRLDPDAPWPAPPPGATWFSVTRSADELSIVCLVGDEPTGSRVEPGWRGLRVTGTLHFDMVGVVAALTVPLAGAGVPVFVLSTYDTDVVLVPADRLELAVSSLSGAGHRVRTVTD